MWVGGVQAGVVSFGNCRGTSIFANLQNHRSWLRSVLAGRMPPTPPKLGSKRREGESMTAYLARTSEERRRWMEYIRREREKRGLGANGRAPRPRIRYQRPSRAPRSNAEMLGMQQSALDRILAEQQHRNQASN